MDRYPKPINPDTAVPAWAYLDVVPKDKFEALSANQTVNLRLPESTVGNIETSSTSSGSPSETSTSQSDNEPIGTFAIIGIAVGSTFGIGLIGLLIYLWKNDKIQSPSSVFAKLGGTPRTGGTSASSNPRHPNILLPNSPSPEQEGPLLPPLAGFREERGPFSPPPRDSTPLRGMTPMSLPSLPSTQHYSNRSTQGDHRMSDPNSSSRPGTSDSLSNAGSMRSIGCVRGQQADYGHALIFPTNRSTVPLMQAQGARNGQRSSGSSQPQLSPLPEM